MVPVELFSAVDQVLRQTIVWHTYNSCVETSPLVQCYTPTPRNILHLLPQNKMILFLLGFYHRHNHCYLSSNKGTFGWLRMSTCNLVRR